MTVPTRMDGATRNRPYIRPIATSGYRPTKNRVPLNLLLCPSMLNGIFTTRSSFQGTRRESGLKPGDGVRGGGFPTLLLLTFAKLFVN
jgi:hypothetical protein